MAWTFTTAVNLMDESFDVSETHQYGIAMILGEYRFSCCVIDFRRNKILGLHHFVQEDPSFRQTDFQALLEHVSNDLPWLKNPFRSIKIAYDGAKATLMPSLLFKHDDAERYLTFNHRLDHNEVVANDHIIPLDAWQVFSLPETLVRAAGEAFSGTRIVHIQSLVIGSVWVNYKNRIKVPHIFIHIRKPYFDMMVFDGRRMSYINTFRFLVPEDLLYYVIFVIEQLELNPETVPVVLLGEIEEGAGIHELMYKYIRNIIFVHRNDACHYSYCLKRIPDHFHYPLLNFFSCGL